MVTKNLEIDTVSQNQIKKVLNRINLLYTIFHFEEINIYIKKSKFIIEFEFNEKLYNKEQQQTILDLISGYKVSYEQFYSLFKDIKIK